MLNIYQAYFKNIWPLKNKSYIVNYKHKNVLIKAPIWTWKSFLFFDWPIFGLYKSSDRTIINKDSKSWEIQLIFSISERYFLIIRKLTLTKSGKDSTKTSLYEITADKNFFDYLNNFEKIVEPNTNNLLTLLKFNQIKLNDLTGEFKQESVLQQALNDILPPKEVALSTIFLPQNSENIFEKKPSERITILKKIFWLLGIDDSKKIIDEEKNKVYWELKARQNTDIYKSKLVWVIEKLKKVQFNLIKINELEDFLMDFQVLDAEKINIDKLSKINLDIEKYLWNLKKVQQEYVKLLQQKENIEKQIFQIKKEKNDLETQFNQIETEILKLQELSNQNTIFEDKLKSIDTKLHTILQNYPNLQEDYEKQLEIRNMIQKLEKDLDLLNQEKIKLLDESKIIEIKLSNQDNSEITKLQKLIWEYKNKINEIKKTINLQSLTFENNTPKSYKEALNLIIEIENQWKNYAQQIKVYENQINSLNENLEKLENKQPKNLEYQCKITQNTCPFVKEILTKFDNSTKIIENQKQNLLSQIQEQQKTLDNLLNKRNYLANWRKQNNISLVKNNLLALQELEDKLSTAYNQFEKLQNQQNNTMKLSWKLEEIKKQIENIETKINNLNEQLSKHKLQLDDKIINNYKFYQQLIEEKNTLISKLSGINEKLSKLIQLNTQKENISLNLDKISKQLSDLENQLKDILKALEKSEQNNNLAAEDEKNLSELQQTLNLYNNILSDYAQNKIEVEKIKRRHKILKDLSNIFWKELVIYVFSDYLKSLEELVNYFISDIVNFTLHIQLDEKWENLDIFVEDNLWKRPVSSLSWGQKTALRIWWILAISKLQNNQMLFLDETINNFDQDSVWLLANKIKEFVKSQNMKFYMITHSEILQQADIWDEIIDLKL